MFLSTTSYIQLSMFVYRKIIAKMYITATVSFVGLTHHLKLMGLRPHYFKAFPFYKSSSVYCTSPLWPQAEDQYMDGVKTSCIEKSPRLQLPGSARWAFLTNCFQHTCSRLCGTLSKIPRLCRFICPISGFIWPGVDFLAYHPKMAVWGLYVARMEI